MVNVMVEVMLFCRYFTFILILFVLCPCLVLIPHVLMLFFLSYLFSLGFEGFVLDMRYETLGIISVFHFFLFLMSYSLTYIVLMSSFWILKCLRCSFFYFMHFLFLVFKDLF